MEWKEEKKGNPEPEEREKWNYKLALCPGQNRTRAEENKWTLLA